MEPIKNNTDKKSIINQATSLLPTINKTVKRTLYRRISNSIEEEDLIPD